MSRFNTVGKRNTPGFEQQRRVGYAEAHVPGDLGHYAEAGVQNGKDHDHLKERIGFFIKTYEQQPRILEIHH